MPLMTSEFNSSEWTNQEVGYAYALGKTILPLKIDVNPKGFISRVQALPFDCTDTKPSCLKVLDLLKENHYLREPLKDCLIRALEKSNSFDSAANKLSLLQSYDNFSVEQANNLLRVFIKNNQVRMCAKGKEFGSLLLSNFDQIIDAMLKEIFLQVKDNFYSPVLGKD
jgi:hypothetical protein